METVHSFRKSTAFIACAHRAGYQLPATATNICPIEELRHLAVGALVRGATVHTSPSSASITTNVEVMTMLKELMAKVDKCNALQTRFNGPEQSQQFLSGDFDNLKESGKQQAEQIKAWLAVQAKRPPAPGCRARCHCHLGHGGERDGDKVHRGGYKRSSTTPWRLQDGAAERDSDVSRQTGQAASGKGPLRGAAGQAGIP